MSSLRKSFASGIFYTAIAKYSNVISTFVISAILARLLTPKEFGIVALVSVFVTFFNLLGNFGLGKAVVQNQELTKNDNESIFNFSIVFAIVLGAGFFFSAPLIARFYGEPVLVEITRLLSLSVLFHTLNVIPKAILEKNLKFKLIGIVSIGVQIITGIIAIILAYKDYSYFALVIKSVLGGAVSFLVLYSLSPIKLTTNFKRSSLEKVLSFSIYNFLFNFINYFTRSGDNLIVGKFLGSAQLGFYDKAYRLMMLPVHQLTHVITPVMIPILSKYQDKNKLVYNTYSKVVKILATVGLPLSVFLFFSANEIINIIYGPQWDKSIPVFKVLSLIIGMQIIYSSAGSVFLSIGRTKLLFNYGLLSSSILIACISLGIFVGGNLVAVGYGIVIGFLMNFFIVYYLLINVALEASMLKFLKCLIYPTVTAIGMVIPLYFISNFGNLNMYLSLILKLMISLLIFGLFTLSVKENRKILREGLQNFIRNT